MKIRYPRKAIVAAKIIKNSFFISQKLFALCLQPPIHPETQRALIRRKLCTFGPAGTNIRRV